MIPDPQPSKTCGSPPKLVAGIPFCSSNERSEVRRTKRNSCHRLGGAPSETCVRNRVLLVGPAQRRPMNKTRFLTQVGESAERWGPRRSILWARRTKRNSCHRLGGAPSETCVRNRVLLVGPAQRRPMNKTRFLTQVGESAERRGPRRSIPWARRTKRNFCHRWAGSHRPFGACLASGLSGCAAACSLRHATRFAAASPRHSAKPGTATNS